jgi:HPt (histidine-containing phosphotransfer) domain-containing protein
MPDPSPELLDPVLVDEFRHVPGDNGLSLFDELADLFIENVPARLELIRVSLADPTKLAFHAHALKSMSLNLGAKAVSALALQLEGLGRSGKVEGAPALLQELMRVADQTYVQVRAARAPR